MKSTILDERRCCRSLALPVLLLPFSLTLSTFSLCLCPSLCLLQPSLSMSFWLSSACLACCLLVCLFVCLCLPCLSAPPPRPSPRPPSLSLSTWLYVTYNSNHCFLSLGLYDSLYFSTAWMIFSVIVSISERGVINTIRVHRTVVSHGFFTTKFHLSRFSGSWRWHRQTDRTDRDSSLFIKIYILFVNFQMWTNACRIPARPMPCAPTHLGGFLVFMPVWIWSRWRTLRRLD